MTVEQTITEEGRTEAIRAIARELRKWEDSGESYEDLAARIYDSVVLRLKIRKESAMKFNLHHCYRTPSGVARISLIDFAGPAEAVHLETHGITRRVMHDAEGRATSGDLKNPRAFDLGEQVWPATRSAAERSA